MTLQRASVTDSPPLRRRPLWVKALRLLFIVTGTYLLVVLVAKCFETTLIHMPSGPEEWSRTPDRVEDVTFDAADGNTIHAWWLPPPDGSRRVLLYCHGNAGNLSHRGPMLAEFQKQLGCGVLLFDYPAYGKSTGWPTEAACHAATDAAFGWLLAKGFAPGEVVLFGESLGGGVASELATKQPVRGLVMCSTYTTIRDAAAHRFPWLPCHLVMSARFDSVANMPNVNCPVVVIHGTADDNIPYWQGEALFAAANEPKRFVRVDGGRHCEWCHDEVWQAMRELIR
jgi:pimeloyl-ACP methyl ester carboxylesterase